MPSRRVVLRRIAGATLAATAVPWGGRTFAAVYLQRDEALKLLAPTASAFERRPITLDAAALASATGTRTPRTFKPECWAARTDAALVGWVLFDHVIGKYELIDYAVGFAPSGAIAGVEIVAYRESHGAEIRNARWRGQFVGRSRPESMRFDEDIRNISGATLSSRHVTEGVQRLSALVLQQLVER